jgi:hypothetical protein
MDHASYSPTPLHKAAHNGHTSVVTVLLDAGADMEAKDEARRVARIETRGASSEACVRHRLQQPVLLAFQRALLL